MDKNKKMTRKTIDFILAFCDELKKEREKWDLGLEDNITVDRGYITQTILSLIYKVLINEGYSRKHLDNFFFFEGEPNKHKERTLKACKFYHTNQKNSSRGVGDFFYKDPRGIRLREEIDKLSE
ncbi:unnamed protein product [marine sediment metagenome]|uniref:Uncharacterized protein n=1 Tax=marine sediment metagenome TaxID=412755 RepID=X1NCZ9_9ZZZZ